MYEHKDWRPRHLAEFIGQKPLISELAVEILGSMDPNRPRPLNHMVFFGPAGLGKTTLVEIMAAERGLPPPVVLMGRNCTHEYLTQVLGGLQSDGYDNQGQLTTPKAATFPLVVIDEAESVPDPTATWELLHRALEPDGSGRRIMLGREVVGRQVKQWPIWLCHFTMVLITNFYGKLLRMAPATMSRFPIKCQFDWYRDEELAQIIQQYASTIGTAITPEAVTMLAARCHGVPRAAIQYTQRAIDFTGGNGSVNQLAVVKMFEVLGINEHGLDRMQVQYLHTLVNVGGGRLGIEALASSNGADRETIESAIEPALLRKGFVVRSSGGREITSAGRVVVLGSGGGHPLYRRAI